MVLRKEKIGIKYQIRKRPILELLNRKKKITNGKLIVFEIKITINYTSPKTNITYQYHT